MRNVVVVDFDECLCSINSFRFWVFFALVHLLLRLRIITFARVVYVCISRLLGATDRLGMKRRVLEYTQGSPVWAVNMFCRLLHSKTNDKVVKKITEYQGQGHDIVLNTAAPLFYVRVYAEFFNFQHVIASPIVTPEMWIENFGLEKLKNLNSIYRGDYALECVITDHIDDLPLIKQAKSVYLVCPNEETLIGLAKINNYQLL